MQLFHLVYVSVAAESFGNDVLLDILRVSRERNEQVGVTGLLLYKKQRFMQLLEGDAAAVRETYGRIERDPRHHDLVVLLQRATPERDFGDWTMGFRNLEEETANATPGYSPFLDIDLSVFQFESDPSRAHQLLRMFRRM